MHFILISKKKNFKEDSINYQFLNSSTAPSLISRESFKCEIKNFVLFIFPYNQIENENYGYSYYANDDNIYLINGMVNVNGNLRNPDIKEFFNELNDSSELLGDYQLLYIDKKGSGALKTPQLSIKQLFFYENDECAILSTEIKLIVDAVQKFRTKTFKNHFDSDFIEDSVFREWGPRQYPEKTIFKDIQRIFPQDMKYFQDGKIVINRKNSFDIPNWFREAYTKDKNMLFDEYYKHLIKFVETNLGYYKSNINKVTLGLTGGFDSRLTVSILSKICKKHKIPFECFTSGADNHPDVVIAKKIAKTSDIKHVHENPDNNLGINTKKYSDYALTFYCAQGDFNSKDFVPSYNREITNISVLSQLGMDAFKRVITDTIYSANRWFARRILFQHNFFFPLFFTEYEMWFALLYAEKDHEAYKEFVYEVLKRADPKLLEIPFAGDSLPQTNLEPYLTTSDSKHHDKEPFLWDYNYVRKNLKTTFIKKYNEKMGKKSKIFFKLLGLNEFDFFFNNEIKKIMELYRTKQTSLYVCIKELIKERSSNQYPRNKTKVKIDKENLFYDLFTPKMQILMDFAAAAEKSSFREIERDIGLFIDDDNFMKM